MIRPSLWNAVRLPVVAAFALVAGLAAQQQQHDLGFKDTPILPNQKWRVHDSDRPHPAVVTPGSGPGAAPSNAVMLFDGKDLSQWAQNGRGANRGKIVDPQWKVEDGYFQAAPVSSICSHGPGLEIANCTSSGRNPPPFAAPARTAATAESTS